MTSRRQFLEHSAAVASAFAATAAFAQTPENTRAGDKTFTNPGPSNTTLVGLNPSSSLPPATDHGTVPPIWYSFDLAHRRVQAGGWTHQVTERELPSSKDIAGVNMRLDRGAFRELHWHLADEWAIMLSGRARVTLLTPTGEMFIDDVNEGDLWIFPAGYPHSIQGIGDTGCEFLLVFNQGNFSEETTFLLSDWLSHTPPDVLAKNFSLAPEILTKLPTGDPLYIFPSAVPSQSLEQDRSEVARRSFPAPKEQFTFKASTMAPTHTNAHGNVKIVDTRNFPASPHISGAIVTVHPGGLREMHWHPTTAEWQYWIKGQGRMTVFNSSQDARTMDFHANDVGLVPRMAGHYIENTGTEDLVFLELFSEGTFKEISLNQWLRAIPAQVATAHTHLTPTDLDHIPAKAEEILG